jgi:hypothetical protein
MDLDFQSIIRSMLAEALARDTNEQIVRDVAEQVAKTLGLDFSKLDFTFDDFVKGMQVELEHTDVTGGDPVATAKIALAHLRERPDYYQRLEKYVEKK